MLGQQMSLGDCCKIRKIPELGLECCVALLWHHIPVSFRSPASQGFGRTVKPPNVSVTGITSSGLLFSYIIKLCSRLSSIVLQLINTGMARERSGEWC